MRCILNESACVEVNFFKPFSLHVTLCLQSCGKMLFYSFFLSILLKQAIISVNQKKKYFTPISK